MKQEVVFGGRISHFAHIQKNISKNVRSAHNENSPVLLGKQTFVWIKKRIMMLDMSTTSSSKEKKIGYRDTDGWTKMNWISCRLFYEKNYEDDHHHRQNNFARTTCHEE